MKTFFSLGFQHSQIPFHAADPRGSYLGDDTNYWNVPPPGTLNTAQRNDLLGKLRNVIAEGQQVDSWIHSVGENGQKSALGDRYDQFRGYVDYAAELWPDVSPVVDRLSSSSPADWSLQADDSWKVDNFLTSTEAAWEIYSVIAKGMAPKKSLTTPGVVPPMAAKPPAGGILQPGNSTTPWLIGGGLALLGIIAVSAIS
jgi:hypothetical protein